MVMPRPTEGDTHKAGVRIPIKILNAIDESASENNRNRTDEIIYALRYYLASKERYGIISVEDPAAPYNLNSESQIQLKLKEMSERQERYEDILSQVLGILKDLDDEPDLLIKLRKALLVQNNHESED